MTLDADMKTRPILFNTDMIRALLDGRKTQTRRVVKPQPVCMDSGAWYPSENPGDNKNKTGKHYGNEQHFRKGFPIDFSPYGQLGDLLWVRETFGIDVDDLIYYKADRRDEPGYYDPPGLKYKPSIYMPRSASRITLKITNVRVEHVQDIKNDDCIAEGIEPSDTGDPVEEQAINRADFAELWNTINAERGYSWESNPWVWVIKFECVKKNVDNYLKEAACSMK